MRKNSLIIMVVIGFWLSLVLPGRSAGKNLIANGGFEKGSADWQIAGEFTLAKGSQGKKALCLDGIGYAESRKIQVSGGKVYYVGGACFADGDEFNQSHLKVKWFDEKGEMIFWEFITPLWLKDKWQEYYHKVLAPKEAAEAAVVCYSHAFEAGTCFDALVFEESSPNPDNLVLDYRFNNVKDYYMQDYSGFGHYARAVYFDPEFYVATPSGRSIEFIKEVPLYFHAFRSESLDPRSGFRLEAVFWLDYLDHVPENGRMWLIDYWVDSGRVYRIFISKKKEVYFQLNTDRDRICETGGQLTSETECHWLEAGYDAEKNEIYLALRHAPQGGLLKLYQTKAVAGLKIEERRTKLAAGERPAAPTPYTRFFINRGEGKQSNFSGVFESLKIYNGLFPKEAK